MEWTDVRGFNYQPSYGTTGLELWMKFDARIIECELGRGKRFFPKMNALRWWLSWDAFKRDGKRFAENFAVCLSLADTAGCRVMPVLFNRWHDSTLDYGGIYIDHFLPRAGWVQQKDMFRPFLEMIVGSHADDPRILAWDLCNEPFAYGRPPQEMPEIFAAEATWLRSLHGQIREIGAKAPVTVGIHQMHGKPGIEQIELISDVLSIHPYWKPTMPKEQFEAMLDDYVAVAARAGKPLVATETCWGAVDDAKRAEIIRYTLGELKKRRIGWFAYLLHFSRIADAHGPDGGPVGSPGNLMFIAEDGMLRPGHDVFNEF